MRGEDRRALERLTLTCKLCYLHANCIFVMVGAHSAKDYAFLVSNLLIYAKMRCKCACFACTNLPLLCWLWSYIVPIIAADAIIKLNS